MKHSDIKKYRHSLPGVELPQNHNKKHSITRLKANLYPPIHKDKPLPLIPSPTNKKWSTSNDELQFKLTLKEKGLFKSKANIEDSDTTISEEKKSKPVIDKMSIFYEIEKSTLIIQKVYKGYMYRKKYIKKKRASKMRNDINSSLNSSAAISEVSIDEKEIDDFNDESFSELDDL